METMIPNPNRPNFSTEQCYRCREQEDAFKGFNRLVRSPPTMFILFYCRACTFKILTEEDGFEAPPSSRKRQWIADRESGLLMSKEKYEGNEQKKWLDLGKRPRIFPITEEEMAIRDDLKKRPFIKFADLKPGAVHKAKIVSLILAQVRGMGAATGTQIPQYQLKFSPAFAEKEWVRLNPTSVTALADSLGDDVSQWGGEEITIRAGDVNGMRAVLVESKKGGK